MNISIYSLEDLLLAAIKSEVESRDIYFRLSNEIEDDFIRTKLKILAEEEDEHRLLFEKIYKKYYPGRDIVVPQKSPVPVPDIEKGNGMSADVIFDNAINAERAAHSFYIQLRDRFQDNPEIKDMLEYLAIRELGHAILFDTFKNDAWLNLMG